MNHYIDDDVDSGIIEALKLAERIGISVCQWHDASDRLHLFSLKDEERLYKEYHQNPVKAD